VVLWNNGGAKGTWVGAIKNRGVVEKVMTPSQKEKAQDLAREWMKKHALVK
jgi:hypothetical protein